MICYTCKANKPPSEFYDIKANKSGKAGQCKACLCENGRKWRNVNKDRQAKNISNWVANNRERDRAKKRKHRLENLDDYNARRCIRKVFTGYKIGSKPYRLLGTDRDTALAYLLKTWEDHYLTPLTDPTKCHVDHIISPSKGGTHHYTNLQLLSPGDNSRKGSK